MKYGRGRIQKVRLDPPRIQKPQLTRDRKVIGFTGVEMKWFLVRLDRESIFPPALETALQNFDPYKPFGESSMQDRSDGFITRAGAVNYQVPLSRKQRRIRAHLIGASHSAPGMMTESNRGIA